MIRKTNITTTLLVFALACVQMVATVAAQRPYRQTDAQVDLILRSVERRADAFRVSLDRALDRNNRLDGTRTEDNINQYVSDYADAADALRERFDARRSVSADMQGVLDRAARIDDFMRRNRLTPKAQNDWSLLKSDLNRLAGAYSITPLWGSNQSSYPPTSPVTGQNNSSGLNYLTGTYRLDSSRSDDPRAIADRATRNLPNSQRQQATDDLLTRLEAPNSIAIEQRGNSVTLASSKAAQTTFEADGRERVERLPSGRTARVRASLAANTLEVSSAGDGARDFSVTFEPIEQGRRLRITRRLNTDRANGLQTLTIQSFYDKTAEVAQWNIYDGGQSYPNNNNNTGATSGGFIVPNGTTFVGVLNDNLTTKDTREGDRFTLTVRDNDNRRFDGATIEGYVSRPERSGRVTGRSALTLNFERIRLRDGGSYRFAGLIDSIRTANGENVRVDNEGQVQEGDSQTTRTVQRAAIGTAVGALIGAIAGGGKGAAIGAGVGAGAGAGSVYVQGRDDLELLSGTEITIRSTAPNNR